MADKTHSSRKSLYKNAGVGTVDLRRKRAELSVALRKQARDDQMLKRRALSPEDGDEICDNEKIYTPAEIVEGLKSQDLCKKVLFARAGRRMLSTEKNPPITPLVSAGIIPLLVDALDTHECTDLQFEASWALTNIASGTTEHTLAVVAGGAIPKLIALLERGGIVAEQSTWALGNIAGDGPVTRDVVLEHGALPAILPYMRPDTPATQLRTNVWTYSNLCRNKNPMVKFELVSPALPYISELLEVTDQAVLADACWALSYLTDGPNERIEAVQLVGQMTGRLVALLGHSAPAVQTPALRTLGNMLTGTDTQTDRCLDAGCLQRVVSLLACGKSSLVKEAAWAASNVLAGTVHQIQRALEHGVLPALVHVLTYHEPKCKKEAAWAFTNLCLGGTEEQLDALVAAGFLEPYCALLASPDQRAVLLILDGINNLLQAAVKYGQVMPLSLKLEEIGVLDQIEALQQHENEQIYTKAVQLIDTYFSEGSDEYTQPAQNENEFQFGNPDNININF